MGSESAPPAERQQQKIKEFLSILPLTVEIAGLPQIEPSRLLTEGQMEVRATAIKAAYKIARQLLVDVSSK
jgi:hypothetical protein